MIPWLFPQLRNNLGIGIYFQSCGTKIVLNGSTVLYASYAMKRKELKPYILDFEFQVFQNILGDMLVFYL